MNAASLKKGLKTNIIGQEIIYFDQTDSTNTQAKLQMEERALDEGTVFISARQSQGKGTDGNEWESGTDNLSLSVIFNNDTKVNTLFPLYPAVALAKVLRAKFNIKAHVKWPNDVLVGTKKIAGILCEGVAAKYMIVGIGINVNQEVFPDTLKQIATSMKLIKGSNFILEEVFQEFIYEYELLLFGNADIRQEWLTHTEMLGKTINTTHQGEDNEVTIIGISDEGFLQIKNSSGELETWMARSGLDISANY